MKYYDLYFEGNQVVFDNLLSIADAYDEPRLGGVQKPSLLYIPVEDKATGDTARAIRAVIEHERCQARGRDRVKKKVLSHIEGVGPGCNRMTAMLEVVHEHFGNTKKGKAMLAKYPFDCPDRVTKQYEDLIQSRIMKYYSKEISGPWINKPHHLTLRLSQIVGLICRDIDDQKPNLGLRLYHGWDVRNSRNVFVIPFRYHRDPRKYEVSDFHRFIVTFNHDTKRWNIKSEKPNEVTARDLMATGSMLFQKTPQLTKYKGW